LFSSRLFPFIAGASTTAEAMAQITDCRRIGAGYIRRTQTQGRLTAMRSWLAVAAMVVLVAAPSQAQMGGGGGRRHQEGDKGTDQKKPKVDEKAYKAALDRIPESKEKYDPWGAARPTQPDKTLPAKTKAK
jgi:hypothetical protein